MDKSIVKLFALLDALANADQPRGVSELARELNLTKTNVHRLLRTLEMSNFVRRTGQVSRYELTLKLWELGTRVVARLDIKKVSAHFLSQLANQTQETVHLSVPDGMEVVYIDKIESPAPVRAHTTIGARAPIYCVATGKAMLAFFPPESIASLEGKLERYTATTITDIRDLEAELARIRQQGFAEYQGEWRDGVNGVAAPIRDMHGNVIAAVGIAGPDARLRPEMFASAAPLVLNAATAISAELGYKAAGANASSSPPNLSDRADHRKSRSAQS
jgi:IclR family transcriptional regulator, KDG regulon repressor